ncbi:response regulator transcription factor [Dehalobacter sp. TeCB1]|uniref:response regulator transcription factor n=1 Tax=Dehalobacter sp. TeCB1 TaxID=1843715 RepID=UPI00083B8168|nr:response regulator transcription factor [Dehalobacter sp. TeCB1]OCZ49834.1 DNA-binding response regulator [Dehalobacter sp. TeCB1]
MNNKILIIEDEKQIARFLELELRHEGYNVQVEYDGWGGLNAVKQKEPDLVLLDIMLPGLDGMAVCRKVRQFSEVPVIMLTAKGQTVDKVTGLDAGANDYITKPFVSEELLARIRAALRKNSSRPEKNLILGNLIMDLSKHHVIRGEDSINLTKREYDLLEYLLRNKEIILSREQILDNVWGYDYIGDTNVVDVYIRYLRSKIDDAYDTKLIHTIRGFGYTAKEQNGEG